MDKEVQPMQQVFKHLKPDHFPNQYENEWVARDGTLWPIAWSNTVLLDSDEQIEYIICTGTDISERNKAAEALRRSETLYKTLFDAAPVAIFTKDLKGRYTSANPNTLRYWPGNPVGHTDAELLPERIAKALRATDIEVMNKGCELIVEEEMLNLEGQSTLLSHKVPLYDAIGKLSGILGITLDITERKRAESELKEAKEATEAANRAKSAFLANMSHELRTPLNTVIGYSEMLVEDLAEMSHQEIVSDLNRIKNAGQHLLKIINNILNFSKINAGTIEKELDLFDIQSLLKELAYRVQPLTEKNHNRLKVTHNTAHLGSMYANRSWVQQVLVNLLSNAAKFTQAGEIKLTATRTVQGQQEWITFCVSDTGIGISPDQIEHVFNAFSQADFSTTRQYGGTGLGLTISRRLCQMMGGDIIVKSQLGEGATFKVHLPAKVTELYSTPDFSQTKNHSYLNSFLHSKPLF